MRLGERVLLAEPLERLEASDWIDAIVVAVPPEWEEPTILLAEELGCGKAASVVTGGATRAESVRIALAEVPDGALAIVVHDAARPLLDDAVIERVLAPLGEGFDGAVPALPISDTVKRVDGRVVVETLDRDGLVTVQTPQAFVTSALKAAASGEGTDCASLVEARGGRIAVVDGDPRLRKVTTEADLELVASWL